MAVGYNPRIVTDGLVLALDVGNAKSFVDLPIQGQQAFTTPGTHTWTCPAGVTSVCVVCIGGGGTGGAYGGSGGSLAYKNNITVTPGQTYTIVVGNTNSQISGSPYSFTAESSSAFGTVASGGEGGYSGSSTSTFKSIGSNYDGGGRGGLASSDWFVSGYGYKGGAGGGAGGYSGDGGNGGKGVTGAGGDTAPTAGSGGGGGGGMPPTSGSSGSGGGTGIFGEGTSGAAGTSSSPNGKGGSGGGDGTQPYGGQYGGGSGNTSMSTTQNMNAQHGAVRIIWGTGRSFPSTLTADVTPQSGATTWTDLIGSNNGTLTNGPTYNSDNGGYLQFPNSNSYIQLSNPVLTTPTSFSVELWVKITDTTTDSIFLSNFDANHDGFEIKFSGASDPKGYWVQHINGVASNTQGATVNQDQWYHVAFHYDGNYGKTFVNGVQIQNGVFGSQTLNITTASTIGAKSYQASSVQNNFEIGALRVYNNKALTAAEVLQNYNATRGRYA